MTGAGSTPDGGPGTPAKVNLSDLWVRVASGIVMIALALATAWAGGHVFILFWLLATGAIVWEWQRIVGAPNPFRNFVIGVAALAAAAGLARSAAADVAVIAVVAGALIVLVLTSGKARLWAAAGIVYAGAVLISVIVLRMALFRGLEAILWLFAIVWCTDIMAYFGGRLIGGPKLWPAVSPKKTWAGFLTGITGGALAGVGVVFLLGDAGKVTFLAPFLTGLFLAAVSQGGDLAESSVKREFGVKDASHLIPGHGGAMDRLDGFAAAVVAAAIIGVSYGGMVRAADGLFAW